MDVKKRPKIVVILGPTASGKSDLARHFNGEIISADSRQVYRGMNIGTGKVTKKEQKLVKHHLIDIASPKKEFNVSDFQKLSGKTISEIISRGKLPIVCGGTGFWIDALAYNTSLPNVPPNKKLRAKLEKQTAEQLFKQLARLDPQRSKNIDKHNKYRLTRALEIIFATGKPVPPVKSHGSAYEIIWLGITWPKKILTERIKIRLDKRLRQGLVSEIKKLSAAGLSHKRLFSFGLEYRWISEYLQGKTSRQEMAEGLYRDIIKFSKRQATWFKRNKDIAWINPKKQNQAFGLVKKFLHS